MPLFGIAIEDFPGLDLADAVNEQGGAIDMLNVDLDVRGRMRSRDGFTKFTTSAAPSPFINLTALPNIVTGPQIIGALNNAKAQTINATTGALVALSGALANTTLLGNFAAFSSPTGAGAPVAYGGVGTALGTILKWDGAAFSNVAIAGVLTPYATNLNAAFFMLANQTPIDNRLMLLNSSSLAGVDGQSLVVWSGAGTPETISSTNYLMLTPGDGERIVGVCNFANQTFVFKQTKFFVFTGTSTDSGGNPVFNYRTVNTGIGAFNAAVGCNPCVAGPDGVYFIAADGIYKTTGGAPQKVSMALDPLFGVGGPVPPYYQQVGLTLPLVGQRHFLASRGNRIYFAFGTAVKLAIMVYDIPTQTWMYWEVRAQGMCINPVTGSLLFAYDGIPSNDVGQFAFGSTTDAGTAITARYRAAYIGFDYSGRTIKRGYHGVEKTIREMIVDGMGTVNTRLAKQWVQPGALPAGQSITLGTSPQVAQSRDRRAVRGRSFSWQIDGTAPFTIEKIVLNLRDISEPTLQRAGS